MALSTYSDLQAVITRWAVRTGDAEFEAQVPDFIALCEARINRRLRVSAMVRMLDLAADETGFADLPADYLEYRAVSAGAVGFEEMEMVAPGSEIGSYDRSGVAARFSIDGGRLRIYPAGNSLVTITYYASIPPLALETPTNWLLATAPDLYLYGSLLEGAPYMEEDGRMALWGDRFETALADLKGNDVGARFAAGRTRVRGDTP